MNLRAMFRGLLSVSLTGVLFLLFSFHAAAEETPRYQLYFGLLHAHTAVSGARGSVEEAFSQAAGVEGLDFFAVTDYSHSFDDDLSGDISTDGTAVSEVWAAGKAAAENATSEQFVGLYGYEMAFRDSDGFGHISTFHTPGFVSRNKEGFDTLTAYYDALTTVPASVSQFNHPGKALGYFRNFSHRTEHYDDAVSLLEIGGENGFTGYEYYIMALDAGWHVAPTSSQNNHHGNFGSESNGRTVILAEALTEEQLYGAMKHRRCYATEDEDLEISYTLNGACMGSILPWQDSLTLEVTVRDATDGLTGTLEILSNGGQPVHAQALTSETVTVSLTGTAGYYFLRLTQNDGDIAVTAPVWVEEAEEPETSGPDASSDPSEPEGSTPEKPSPEESTPEEDDSPMEALDIRFCFGLLHGHTDLSDGNCTVEEAYAQAAKQDNMDFYAVTDHSNSFDNDLSGIIAEDAAPVSESWARGKIAAKNATTSDFVGIFGYEMTWPDDRNLGHITTFRTPGFVSRSKEGFEELESYYEALTTVPGSVSQFCHPGPELGEFENFKHHSAGYDQVMMLLEIGGENGFDAYPSYIKSLDAGWHVAPTVSHNDHEGNSGALNDARTVILARELTENALYDAMAQRRVYATEDGDLSLYYTLDGHLMGDILPGREEHQLRLLLSDPTDSGDAAVEIITDGGERLLSCPMPQSGALNLTVPGGKHYYFLRVIQSDGDIAVTAPVWTESYSDMGIVSFSTDTQVPLPGQKLTLNLTLWNEETLPFQMTSLKISANGTTVYRADSPGTVEAGQTKVLTIPYSQTAAGAVTLTAEVTGTIGGVSRTDRAELTLHFRAKEMAKGILVDLGHSSHSAGDFDNLAVLAEDANMTVSCFTGDLPAEGSILILPPPGKAYEPDFLQQVKIFCARGGKLVVCGSSDTKNAKTAEHQNRLLQTIGSTLSLRADTALDAVHSGGVPETLYPTNFNRTAFFCEKITNEQFYVHLSGSTVDPGLGTWLVKGGKTTCSSQTSMTEPVLLAWEEFSSGAHILVSGSLFLSDEAIPLPKNRWDAPTGNQTIVEALLGITRQDFTVTPIAGVRRGKQNMLYYIKGYTTSGTSNKYNTFPDTIYLQDDTGGIAISPFREMGVQVGTPMVVAGYLEKQDGNPVLVPVDYDFPEEKSYRYVPKTKNHSRLLDYKTYGGQLVQAEAEVTAVTLTEDGLGVRRFVLTDEWGDRITVMIGKTIFSGAYGTNTLASEVKIGRTVRAMGLLHLDSNGIPVIRVRNCEEVVWVPSIPRPGSKDNPYTGDPIGKWADTLSVSLCGILLIFRREKKRSDR